MLESESAHLRLRLLHHMPQGLLVVYVRGLAILQAKPRGLLLGSCKLNQETFSRAVALSIDERRCA